VEVTVAGRRSTSDLLVLLVASVVGEVLVFVEAVPFAVISVWGSKEVSVLLDPPGGRYS
jgi:hypothetical protein